MNNSGCWELVGGAEACNRTCVAGCANPEHLDTLKACFKWCMQRREQGIPRGRGAGRGSERGHPACFGMLSLCAVSAGMLHCTVLITLSL